MFSLKTNNKNSFFLPKIKNFLLKFYFYLFHYKKLLDYYNISKLINFKSFNQIRFI